MRLIAGRLAEPPSTSTFTATSVITGRAHLAVQPADVGLDVLVGPHVFALAEILARQAVEQAAVHVVADAEVDHPRAELVVLLGVGDDLGFVRLAGRRQAVGQEQDVSSAAMSSLIMPRAVVSAPSMFVLPPA